MKKTTIEISQEAYETLQQLRKYYPDLTEAELIRTAVLKGVEILDPDLYQSWMESRKTQDGR